MPVSTSGAPSPHQETHIPSFLMASTYVVRSRSSSAGVPPGVLGARFEAPPGKDDEKRREGIKTARWIEGLVDCAELAGELGCGKLVCVPNREADINVRFEEQLAQPKADLLVRSKGRRRVAGGTSLLEAMRTTPACARTVVAIDRLTARPKRSNRPAPPGRAKRSATLVLRARTVELAPTGRQYRGKPPMRLQAVLVGEERKPEGVDPIQGLLLTALAVDTPEACQRVVEFYARRWRIEDWRRILQSGCKVEELANRAAVRIARAPAIDLVIAWRILLLTLLGREHPDLPPDAMFSDMEIHVLNAFAAQQGLDSTLR